MDKDTPINAFIVSFFMAVLLLPILLYLLGVRAEPFEERSLSNAPEFRVDRLLEPAFYKELNDFLSDANPVRETAVVANARFSNWVFGDVISRQVIAGKNNWLFFRQTVTSKCADPGDLRNQIENFAGLLSAISEKGIETHVTIAPDKASIYPEKLSREAELASYCANKNRESIRLMMSEHSQINFLDSWNLLTEKKTDSEHLLYSTDDTHWTEYGSTAYVAELVKEFASELSWAGIEKTGLEKVKPDLSRMAGMYYERDRSAVHFIRGARHNRNPSNVNIFGQPQYLIHNTSTSNSPMVSRKVLFLHDSFLYVAWDQVAQFFSDVLYLHWSALSPEQFASLVSEADIVIIESVEREIYDRLNTHFGDTLYARAIQGIETHLENEPKKWPLFAQQ